MSTFNLRKPFFKVMQGSLLLFLLSACQKEGKDAASMSDASLGKGAKNDKAAQTEKVNTFYGPQVQMGDGKARSFFTLSHAGMPVELGIEMTAGSLVNLPHDHDLASFVIPLHQKAQATTPFEHIVINWNEHGHPPFELFGAQHFDFHFYTISLAERLAIPAYTPGDLHDVEPAEQYRPVGFVPTPGGEAQMGKHWIDVINPVLPGTFTHTMIYGSYNGEINFIEPMITRAFLQSGVAVSTDYGQPAAYQEKGTYYPTRYNIKTGADGKRYISLSNFVLR